MFQSTRQRLRDQINLFRNTSDPVLFAELLDPKSFKGALQALESFRAEVGSASPNDRVRLVNATLKMIASSVVVDRPNRVEPRAKKRRPKPHRLLTEPRRTARKRLLAKG